VHEDEKITFTADGPVKIFVASPDQNDESNRNYVGGRRANVFEVLAKNCEFTMYRPRVRAASATDEQMAKQWAKTELAIKALEKGEPVTIIFYQPEVDIRRSVVTRISGIGSAVFRHN
jgi:hypothetical protein